MCKRVPEILSYRGPVDPSTVPDPQAHPAAANSHLSVKIGARLQVGTE